MLHVPHLVFMRLMPQALTVTPKDGLPLLQQLWNEFFSAMHGRTHGEFPVFLRRRIWAHSQKHRSLPSEAQPGCAALFYYPEPIPRLPRIWEAVQFHSLQPSMFQNVDCVVAGLISDFLVAHEPLEISLERFESLGSKQQLAHGLED